MNHMRAIAKMLGVEIDEEFCIAKYPEYMTYRLTEVAGLQSKKYNGAWNSKGNEGEFRDILTGYAAIIKKPWKPRNDETYFYISSGDKICTAVFADWCFSDLEHVKIGNFFKTREEAYNNLKKYEEWILSEPDMSWRVKE